MAAFGKRETHVGSGIDKPERQSLGQRLHNWVLALLKPARRGPAGNGTAQAAKPSKARRR
jgi:hypothetical protein